MQTVIDIYRGWEISFDTDNETFTCYSNSRDEEISGKVSYAACKTNIDNFIKENHEFTPFKVIELGYRKPNIYNIIGIRKDGAFSYKDDEDKVHKISKYDVDKIFLMKEGVFDMINEVNEIEKQADELREKARKIKKDFVKTMVSLTEYKKQLQD